MKMLQKIIDCESLEISLGNFYNGVSFRKVASLKCSDCNFAKKRTHHIFFLEYVPKTSYIKKYLKSSFFEKKVYGGPAS